MSRSASAAATTAAIAARGDGGFEQRGGVVVKHDVFLCGEVAVEGGGGGLGGLGDLLDGGVLVALDLEETQRRGLDGAAQLDLLAFPETGGRIGRCAHWV